MSGLAIATQALLGAAGVTAVTGPRIWGWVAEEGASNPSIVVHRLSEPEDALLTAELVETRVQIDCRGDTPPAADSLGELVIAALNAITGATVFGFTATFIKGTSDVSGTQETPEVFIRSIDYRIKWCR